MKKIFYIILGVLLIFVGAGLFLRPVESFATFGYIFGFTILFSGILNLILYFYARKYGKQNSTMLIVSIIDILFALLILCDVFAKFALDMVIVYMASFSLILIGIVRVIEFIKFNKITGGKLILVLISGILLIIAGCICVIHPFIPMIAMGWCLAFNIIMTGFDIISLTAFIE